MGSIPLIQTGLPTLPANSQLWPIKAQGAVMRLNPASDPEIESIYHASMEQGRLLERSLTDANFLLQEKKKELLARIQSYLDLNKVGTDAQFKHKLRVFKLAADIISFIQKINKFQQQITGLISAVTTNIGLLQSMEQNMLQMIQSNLNAIANLLNNICNWGLPDLPAIPNLFSDTIWKWNGFNFFPLASFKPKIGFDTNFAFNMCVLHIPNVNIFRNFPSTVQTYSGLSYGTPLFVPPLGGIIPNTDQNLGDPVFIASMQATTVEPVYNPAFNPLSDMLGSVPDPAQIISDYQMPAQVYQDNIVSITPSLRENVIEPSDPDFASPNLPLRQANLRKDLVHYITLEAVVASNYDPYITSAWLFYMNFARNGRKGQWLENYEEVFAQYIIPSIVQLGQHDIPWNTVLGGPGTVDTPTDIPFTDTLTALGPDDLNHALWQLSYIEASLLGYNRAKDWDAGADTTYLANFTAADLDYESLTIDLTDTQTTVLGLGQATYPQPVTYPKAIAGVLAQVIDLANTLIINTPNYSSPHPQYRFIFDTFGVATMVDRFSQFWRQFNANLQALLTQDPYIVAQVTNYVAGLDSAVDPLGTLTIYNQIVADANSRNRAWVTGTPLLNIPTAPVVVYSNSTTPTNQNNGWDATGTTLDASAFLARPDIQGQPIAVQIAMLRTNLAASSLMVYSQQMQDEVATQIQTAQTLLQDLNTMGFTVQASADTTTVGITSSDVTVFENGFGIDFGTQFALSASSVIPAVTAQAAVQFDEILFDMTGYVTSPTQFTVQTTGTFSVAGSLQWDTGDAGVRTVTVYVGTLAIFTVSTDSEPGPTPLQFAFDFAFNQGDVVTVIASHNLPTSQNILPGSVFMMIQTSPIAATPTVAPNTTDPVTFTAKVSMKALTAVVIGSDGTISPVDPTTVQTDDNGNTIAPYPDGILVADVVAGGTGQVATAYGGVFQQGGFSLPETSPGFGGSELLVGGLLYVFPGGMLTQDYKSLVGANVQWIIVAGRATASDTFIYEPQVPTRTYMAF